jgi:hydroxymethylpyrimidine/phosphomethylpyrimidine kinase
MRRFIPRDIPVSGMDVQQMPCACTIAGSDPSGGAGIQSDLKTFTSIGVWGLTVVTAVTSQNSNVVRGIWAVPQDAIRLQIQTLLEDFEIRAYKTGMLPDRDSVAAAAWGVPEKAVLVVDPVMISSTGRPLMDMDALEVLKSVLIPRATLVTPNISEAEVLSETGRITTIEEMRKAGRTILKTGPEYVLVKGGHRTGPGAVDLLIGPEEELILSGRRSPFDAHGTGCCLSAAITAHLALGESIPEACTSAKEFIGLAIAAAVKGRTGNYIVDPLFQKQ